MFVISAGTKKPAAGPSIGGCRAGGESADRIRNDRFFLSLFLLNLQLFRKRKYERSFIINDKR
jgi:hypothetical protein